MRLLLAILVMAIFSGCTTEGVSPDRGGPPAALDEEQPKTEQFEFEFQMKPSVGLALPDGSQNAFGIAPVAERFDIGGEAVHLRVIALWNASQPLSEDLQLYVNNGEGVVGEISGPSPLVVEIDTPLDPGSYGVGVLPSNAGATVDERVVVQVQVLYE